MTVNAGDFLAEVKRIDSDVALQKDAEHFMMSNEEILKNMRPKQTLILQSERGNFGRHITLEKVLKNLTLTGNCKVK